MLPLAFLSVHDTVMSNTRALPVVATHPDPAGPMTQRTVPDPPASIAALAVSHWNWSVTAIWAAVQPVVKQPGSAGLVAVKLSYPPNDTRQIGADAILNIVSLLRSDGAVVGGVVVF